MKYYPAARKDELLVTAWMKLIDTMLSQAPKRIHCAILFK